MISMNKTKIAKTLIAALAGTALLSGAAMAADTSSSAGSKIDSSMKKVDGFMDDSGITAKAKAALVDDEAIKSAARRRDAERFCHLAGPGREGCGAGAEGGRG
jgi:osmotically-inducible protein OsmY